MFFIFFFFFEEDIEEILRVRNESVMIGDIPHVEFELSYPGYYEWYALEEDSSIRLFSTMKFSLSSSGIDNSVIACE